MHSMMICENLCAFTGTIDIVKAIILIRNNLPDLIPYEHIYCISHGVGSLVTCPYGPCGPEDIPLQTFPLHKNSQTHHIVGSVAPPIQLT